MEQYTTLGQSTLSVPYVSGSGTVVVTSATSFPSGPTFSILVGSAYYTVTAVVSTTFSVTLEFGTDANVASGSVVEVVTARTLTQLKIDGLDLLNRITGPIGIKGQFGQKAVACNASATIDLLPLTSGSGYVDDIWLAIYQGGLINVYIDGEMSPSISIPTWALTGNAYYTERPAVATPWFASNGTGGASGGLGLKLSLPIPFSTSIQIQYENNTGTNVTVWSMISYQLGVPNIYPYTKKLFVVPNLNLGGASPVDTVLTFLNISPGTPGRLAGFFWIADPASGSASPGTGPLEGKFKIYVDGAMSPTYQSSGSEDMFGMAGYFSGYSSPVIAGDYGLLQKGSSTYEAYRFFIKDPIVFQSSLKITWNVGDSSAVNFTGNCYASFCVFYYLG